MYKTLVLLVAGSMASSILPMGEVQAQIFRRGGSYGLCGDPSCSMCYPQSNCVDGNCYVDQYQVVRTKDPSNQEVGPLAQTPQNIVERALQEAGVITSDVVYDLGCGDGRVLKTAWDKHRAKGVGIEKDQNQVVQAISNCEDYPITIIYGDSTKMNIGNADVVYMYMTPEFMNEIAPKLRTARVAVSFMHPIPGYKNRSVAIDGKTLYIANPKAESSILPTIQVSRWVPMEKK